MSDAAGVVAGNVYDKYGTRNPIARALMAGFLRTVRRFYREAGGDSVLEIGCGEGHLLAELLEERRPALAVASDLSASVLVDASASHGGGVGFAAANAYQLPFGDQSFDLVLACEVLEHLDEPARAVNELARVCRGEVIVTVPREPLWRALNMMRGRYLSQLGNTPGHVRHLSRRAIVRLVATRFDIIDVSSPVPWTAIRARARSGG